MGETADGPYLLLSDLLIGGDRTVNTYTGKESWVSRSHNFVADCWHTQEYVMTDSDGEYKWLYQKLYILKGRNEVDRLVDAAMQSNVFAKNKEDYKRFSITGLDQAWCMSNQCIAVKNNRILVVDAWFETEEEQKMTLMAVAEKWKR